MSDIYTIDEHKKNSEFYYFGILPQVCIHTPEGDQYSDMYIPREFCDCGCSEWVEGKMKIVEDSMGYEFPQKDVHRCKDCNGVRVADHRGVKDE